jgi:hypothetical protein
MGGSSWAGGGGGAGGFEARCLDGAALAGAGGWGSATSNTDSLMVGVDSYGGGGWVIGYLLSGFNLSSKTIGCFSEKGIRNNTQPSPLLDTVSSGLPNNP